MTRRTAVPGYWGHACRLLEERDPQLARLVDRHRGDVLTSHSDVFRTLVNAVVGQQISVSAAAAIWGRLEAAYPGLEPADLADADPDILRAVGLSRQKVEYIRGIAHAFSSGRIDPDRIASAPDREASAELESLKGVGPWTAQMVLIFALLRPDVLPLGDIGLLRSACRSFGWDEDLAPREVAGLLEARAEDWRPYRTVAVWYLWRELDAEPVLY